jgi:glutaredoxin 3
VSYVERVLSTVPEPVVIFAKSYCPYCLKVKEVLKKNHVATHVIELDQRADGVWLQQALTQKYRQATVPYIFAKGHFMGGSSDILTANKEDLNGKMRKSLQ